jgi:hypothetical protein
MGVEEEASKRVDLVQQLEIDVKSLKKKLNKLSKQVNEQVAISGFQDQLSAFDKRITKLEELSLEICRVIASDEVNTLTLFLDQRLVKDLPPNFEKAREFLLIQSTAARQEIKHSLSPITVANQFEINCRSYFKAHGLKGFRE